MQRPLLLNGFMGSGKSTVGRLVAERSGRPFVDLDERIAAKAEKPVARIFAEDGEAAFRKVEADALRECLEAPEEPGVVALGGGALLRRAERLFAVDRSVVITLSASAETIASRTRGSGRPLLAAGDPNRRIADLLEARSLAYAECHAKVGTDGRSPEHVAEDVLAIWRRDPLAVAAGYASYAVDIGRGIAAERAAAGSIGASRALLISDTNVGPLHAPRVETALGRHGVTFDTIVFAAGEAHKNAETLARLWQGALSSGADRRSRILALGGGVVTDVAGFAAATWMRGIDWLALPTTLLAMVDASVGGKTAIDLPGAKNAVGAFWQPRAVACDVDLLQTEPERGYVSALAEVIKTAIIGDSELLSLVEQNAADARGRSPELLLEMVRRSIRVKARIVSADEREGGLRACLNLGHTVGHALEAHGGYGHLSHGEAVSLGLLAALRIGEGLGITPPALTERTLQVLDAVGLPTDLTAHPVEAALDLLANDKKRAGSRLRFILAKDVGDVVLVDLELDEVRARCLEAARR